MRQELYRIGNNLNQLTATAHAKGWLHSQRLNDTLDELNTVLIRLAEDLIAHKVNIPEVLNRGQNDDEVENKKTAN